jgi:hypothetical protein
LEPHWNPATFPLLDALPAIVEETATAAPVDPAEQAQVNEQVSVPAIGPGRVWWGEASVEVVHATRSWIQYGTLAFAVICIVIGAVEALFGR